jgi:carbon-monoxide dehydrogenase large subunit
MVRAFHDYVLPSTMDVPPRVEFVHLETAVADDPVNYVGIGEGGNILAPAALANAVEDALSPFGARITKLPLSPTRVLELIGAI